MNTEKRYKHLVLITVLFTLGMVLSDVFVNIFIWRLKSNFELICIYAISTYAVVPFVFYFLAFSFSFFVDISTVHCSVDD